VRVSEEFPSRYLKGSDIVGQKLKVTISEVTREEMPDGKFKPCLWFTGGSKGLILNKVNSLVIKGIADGRGADGDDMATWVGLPLVMSTEVVTAFGQTGPAVRVYDVPQAIPHDLPDEEVPF